MNFDTKYIEKIKGNYNYFQYIAEIHIYKKKKNMGKMELKKLSNYFITY